MLGGQFLNYNGNHLGEKKIKLVSCVLQKEQLILGSGRVGLRNIGNTVSLSQYASSRLEWKWSCFLLFFVSHSVFPECNSAMFVSHVWPAGLLPPEAIQTGEVCQRGCQTDRRFPLLSCIFFFIVSFLLGHILCFPRLLLFHLPTPWFLLMLQLSLRC